MYLPGVTILIQVHHDAVLCVSFRGHILSTSKSPYCTLRLCPGSKSSYNYLTILYFTSLLGVTILLQVHHHTVHYVSARGHNPSTSTSPYFTIRLCSGSQSLYKYITILYFSSLPGVTIHQQVHHHTLLYVSARGYNPSTSTSPYCTLRLCQESQSLYKYITILYFTSLPVVTTLVQVHHDAVLCIICTFTSLPGVTIPLRTSTYITILYFTSLPRVTIILQYITILYFTSLPGFTIFQQVHHHTVLYVSARGHNPSTSTSPYSTLRLYPGSQCFYKFITKLYNQGHNPSTSTSPYCTLRLCPGSQSFYKYITMLYFTSLPGFTIILQVHHHTVLYVSARGHNPSTSTSPYCTYVSARVTMLLQVHHQAVLYVCDQGHNPSTSTSPYCTLRLCPGSQSFYKYITILYVTSLPGSQSFYKYITILYFTSLSWAQSFYKYITILYYTSLSGVAIILQVHHHTVLYVSARGHNPSSPTVLYISTRGQVHHHTFLNVSAQGHNPSTSTSPYCTPRLCPGSQSFHKYITILYLTSLPVVTILLQVHHHTVLYLSVWGHSPSTSTSPYSTSLPGVTVLLKCISLYCIYVSARSHNPSTRTSPYCTLLLCPGS